MALLAGGFVGCKKDSYVALFDQLPQDRMSDSIKYVQKTLTSAPNGWVAIMPTSFGGGYGFYMTFDEASNVTMYSDWSTAFASTAFKSQYRIKADQGASLSFDTYNYITELNDPDRSVRNGYGGDIDFIYDHTSGDSLIMLGKRYRQKLSLIKATAAQKAQYTSGAYATAITNFANFFVNNKNAFIQLEDNTKIAIEPNFTTNLGAGKRITLTALSTSGAISSATAKFALTVDQMAILDSGVNISALRFVKVAWKDATTMAIYTSTGKEYIINNSPAPILPLYMLMGVKYSTLYSAFKTIYPGTSTAGATILNYFHNNLNNATATGGYSFNSGNIKLTWDLVNTRVTFNGFSSQNGGTSGWTTTITYKYTVDNSGVYKFTLYSAASGGYVANIMTQLDAFLRNNSVKLDYYIDTTDPNKTVYGQMSSVETPTTAMTFVLQ